MNFSRLRYDNDTYVHNLQQSIGVGEYSIGTPHNDCDNCSYYAPGINLDHSGSAVCDKALIDVDSELLNITRKASDCPSQKYLPNQKPFCNVNFKNKKECDFLIPEYTLISNPKCTGHESTANRWEWLCTNPQDKAMIDFDYNINNRLIVKDAHRLCLPNPLDQTLSLPPKCNENIRYDWSSKYNKPEVSIAANQLAYCANIPKL